MTAAATHFPAFPSAKPRRDFQDQAVSILLMILLFFFFVGPKIEGFPIPIRIDDFIFILLLPLGYRYVTRRKSTVFFWIVAYFAVNFIPYFAGLVTGTYDVGIYPIIMVKEVEYFYIAYLVCENRSPWVLGSVDLLCLLIIGNGLRAIYQLDIDYYGIGVMGNVGAPSLAAGLYLFSTIWLHIRSKLLVNPLLRGLVRLILAAGSVCVVATISRSGIAALVAYWGTYLVVTNLRAIPLFAAGLALTPKLVEVAAGAVGSSYGTLAGTIMRRAGAVGEASGVRSEKWQQYLYPFQPIDFVFGKGKGYPNALEGYFGMGVDSQYVRTIMENGFVGMAILAGLLLTILREIHRRRGEWEHAWAVLVAMLVMSVPFEAFQVSKTGGFFWLLMFYLYMCQRKPLPAARVA